MKMTNKARASRMALAAVLAALFAGCAATVAATALAIPASPAGLYLAALTAVALCGIGALSGPGAIVAAALFAVTPLTVIFRRRPRCSSTSTLKSRSRENTPAVSFASSASKRISS